MKYLFQCPPIETIIDLAKFVGLIRPGVREIFLEHNLPIMFDYHILNDYIKKNKLIFQEDIINCLKIIYDYDNLHAEMRRKKAPHLYLPVDDESHLNEKDQKLFERLYDTLNPHVLSKGHCLTVAYVILLQLNELYE